MPKGKASIGKCIFCQKSFPKTSLARHINSHLAEKTVGGKPGKSFQVKIETNPRWGSTPYFLYLWADGNTTLQKIDTLLRQIWLECCGHMSAFRMPRQQRTGMANFIKALSHGDFINAEHGNGEIPMNKMIKDVLRKDMKLEYQYDFGSTTELQLSVLEEFDIAADKSLVLLSRNDRPLWMCAMCGQKPATQLCVVCTEDALFCAACAKKHAKTCSDFADYAAMPVVNSPRMGVCAYDGGTIDKERD